MTPEEFNAPVPEPNPKPLARVLKSIRIGSNYTAPKKKRKKS